MEKTPVRKYQVIEEAEIDLVLQCKDSREFYDRYTKVFPDAKKSLDSISKIWKRKSEFAKKRPLSIPAHGAGAKSTSEIAALIAEQTKIMKDIATLARENLEINQQILDALMQQNRVLTGHTEENTKEPVHHAPLQKPAVQDISPGMQTPILVGS
jgi:hypothetical protein